MFSLILDIFTWKECINSLFSETVTVIITDRTGLHSVLLPFIVSEDSRGRTRRTGSHESRIDKRELAVTNDEYYKNFYFSREKIAPVTLREKTIRDPIYT